MLYNMVTDIAISSRKPDSLESRPGSNECTSLIRPPRERADYHINDTFIIYLLEKKTHYIQNNQILNPFKPG